MRIKKIIAGILTFSIVFGIVPQINAESSALADEPAGMSLSEKNMQISGTNSFGNMVAQELASVSSEQEANNGCNVFSVEISGTTARVSFETLYDSALVVAIYDNEGMQMITSGYKEVTAEETETEVEISETIPQYFYIRAYLVNPDTLRPLSTEYSSPMYTEEMQEFLSKTTADFDSDRVLNLDDNPDTNFAVFGEDTTLIHENGQTNVVISANEATLTYVFENPDESLSVLEEGGVFAFEYNGDLVILKAVSVEKGVDKDSGKVTSVTVVGQEAELEEAFEHLRIDGKANTDNAEIDDSNMDEGVTCGGLVDDAEEGEISPLALDVTGKSSKSVNFSIADKKAGSFEFSSDLNFKIGTSAKVYLSFSEIYVEFKLDLTAKLSLEFEVSATIKMLEKKMRLAYIAIHICPGVYFSVTPEFVLELSGKASIEGTLSATVGFKVSKNGIENLSSAPKFVAKGGIEVTIFIGFLLKPALSVVHEKVFNLSLDAKSGVEITAKLEASTEKDPTCIHECDICIDGEIKGKFSIDITIKLLDSERLKFKLSLLEVSVHVADFYISPTFGEFAFSKCPHYKYQTFLTVKNKEDSYINGVNIVIDNDELFEYTTEGKGEVELWLTKGKHKVELEATDYKTKVTNINVKEGGKRFTVTIEKGNDKSSEDLLSDILDKFHSGSSNPGDLDYGKAWDLRVKQVSLGGSHSAAITSDGSLYMWGRNYDGQLGDGTRTDKKTPVKIMENVSSVSLGDYHSAAITSDGSVYMWGFNGLGELGYGGVGGIRLIPIKIFDSFSYFSLGHQCSAAISSDGSLYMWGSNMWGKLGNGTTEDSPIPIKIMDNVSSISLGGDHGAAITNDGSLYMWGRNDYGQLGDGTRTNKKTPVKIMENVSSVSLGGNNSAAVTSDGDLYIWGKECYSKVPIKIMDNVSSISLGGNHGAAITNDGSLYMWGSNSSGQLGDGTRTNKKTPVKIMENVSSVSLGDYHSAAITTDGSLYMWGNNSSGALGNGTTEDSNVPIKIAFPDSDPTPGSSPYYLSPSSTSPSTLTSLLPNEIYNIYSVTSRTVNKELASDNLLYIGQAVSDANGNLTIPSAAQNGTVFVKALHVFDVYNAPITSAEVKGQSVSLKWNPVENASEYEVYCYTTDGILSQTKTAATSLTINNLEKGEYYGFLVTSIIHGEQSVPAIGDVRMVQIPKGILGDLNSDGKVTIIDARWLLQAASGSRELTDEQKAVADINGDGKITIIDARWLLQVASGSRELDN